MQEAPEEPVLDGVAPALLCPRGTRLSYHRTDRRTRERGAVTVDAQARGRRPDPLHLHGRRAFIFFERDDIMLRLAGETEAETAQWIMTSSTP